MTTSWRVGLVAAVATFAGLSAGAPAQNPLRDAAAIERYQQLARAIPTSVVPGRVSTTWIDNDTFEFTRAGQRFRYAIAARRTTPLGPVEPPRPGAATPGNGVPLPSPNGVRQAWSRDGTVWIAQAGGANPVRVAGAADRVSYGAPPRIYREELSQSAGLWWSPDGDRLAFYRADARRVPDYPALDGGPARATAGEPYPTPASAGFAVDVLVYDVASRRTVRLDVRAAGATGRDATDYLLRPAWTADGTEVVLQRLNRRQNVLELMTCRADSGRCRTVVRETSPTWVDAHSEPLFLRDGRRFLWISARSGFRNLYLYDLDGQLLTTLTNHRFDVGEVHLVVETAGAVFYAAYDGNNPLKAQLHRVSLTGAGDVRLTDPAFHHTASVSPGGQHFVDVSETHDRAPTSRLLATGGAVVAELAASDTTRFDTLGLNPVELFTFTAADGTTTLHGTLHRPSTFDPAQRYPLLVDAYAGPGTTGVNETFTLPNRLTELGFLVAAFESRGAPGRGRQVADAIYQQLGRVEVDDQAAGVRALLSRPYVDAQRVGIYGTSYGGYAAVMALLRHPGVFAAAGGSSAVTDWRQYKGVYSERYLGLLADNRAAYDRAGVLPVAPGLRGPLLLYYATADDNVHPSHTLQLVETLRRAGTTVEVQIGQGLGHTSVGEDAMMTFFTSALASRTPAARP